MDLYKMRLLLEVILCLNILSNIYAATTQESCQNIRFKCTEDDPREKIYSYCKMYSKDWTLWCNQSSITKIPEPGTILPYMSCSNATAMYFDDSCLKEIHKGDLGKYPNITKFLCGKNYLKNLPDYLFEKNKRLTEINFCGNEIKEIHSKTFAGLSNLEILNLASNKLTQISHDVLFDDLGSLRELSFHNNKITTLQAGVFRGLKNLHKLTLTANEISFIDKRAFHFLESLTHLHLDQNNLISVDAKIFVELSNLGTLTLSNNNMAEWKELEENSLQSVHTLNLASNKISKFQSGHVRNMSKLQNLSLESNKLTSLPNDLFSGTISLRYLDVGYNYLESVGKHTFSHLCHLETLVLRKNNLKTPLVEWFVQIIKNNITDGNDVSNNKWNCSCCKAIDYEKFLNDLRVKEKLDPTLSPWSDTLRITCSFPAHLRNKKLDEETIKTMQERNRKSKNATQQVLCSLPKTEFKRVTTTHKYIPTNSTNNINEATMRNNAISSEKRFDMTPIIEAERQELSEDKIQASYIYAFVGVGIFIILVIVATGKYSRHKLLRKNKSFQSTSRLPASTVGQGDYTDTYNHLNIEESRTAMLPHTESKHYSIILECETIPKTVIDVTRNVELDENEYTVMKSVSGTPGAT